MLGAIPQLCYRHGPWHAVDYGDSHLLRETARLVLDGRMWTKRVMSARAPKWMAARSRFVRIWRRQVQTGDKHRQAVALTKNAVADRLQPRSQTEYARLGLLTSCGMDQTI